MAMAVLIIPDASHCDLYDGGYTELEGLLQKTKLLLLKVDMIGELRVLYKIMDFQDKRGTE